MIRTRQRTEWGFTLIEISLVVMIIGIMAVPLYLLIARELENLHVRQTTDALELAREALVTYAAQNNGCLPFAADFEGGRIDTNALGSGGYTDTGIGIANQHAGDLPWTDLGLGSNLLDGNRLRIQYFVASQYTDSDADPSNGISCNAGYRGLERRRSAFPMPTARAEIAICLPRCPIPGSLRSGSNFSITPPTRLSDRSCCRSNRPI